MEESSLYRKESMERIQSPEQLNDYLRITNPTIWILLIAVIILLAGMLIWSSYATIGSFAQGTARVENGEMTVLFDDANLARSVKAGMDIHHGGRRYFHGKKCGPQRERRRFRAGGHDPGRRCL